MYLCEIISITPVKNIFRVLKNEVRSKNLLEGVHNPPINPSPNNVAFINAFMVYSIQTEILELLLFLI